MRRLGVVMSQLTNQELIALVGRLESGEYDGADLMDSWIAIRELIDRRITEEED